VSVRKGDTRSGSGERHSRRHTEAPKASDFLGIYLSLSVGSEPAYRSLFAAVEFGRKDGSVILAGTANSPQKCYLKPNHFGQIRGLQRHDRISHPWFLGIFCYCPGHVQP